LTDGLALNVVRSQIGGELCLAKLNVVIDDNLTQLEPREASRNIVAQNESPAVVQRGKGSAVGGREVDPLPHAIVNCAIPMALKRLINRSFDTAREVHEGPLLDGNGGRRVLGERQINGAWSRRRVGRHEPDPNTVESIRLPASSNGVEPREDEVVARIQAEGCGLEDVTAASGGGLDINLVDEFGLDNPKVPIL